MGINIITNPKVIQIGDTTQIQDHPITLHSFNTINVIVSNVVNPGKHPICILTLFI